MACGLLPRACEGTLPLHMPEHSDLDLQQVKHAAALARLNLTDEELVAIHSDLASILTHIDQLAKVEVDGIEPMSSPHGHCSRLHDDEIETPIPRQIVLDMAPATEGPAILVPKVLDDGAGS